MFDFSQPGVSSCSRWWLSVMTFPLWNPMGNVWSLNHLQEVQKNDKKNGGKKERDNKLTSKHQWSHLGFSLQRKQQQWNRWPEVPSDFFGGFLADMRHGIVVYRPSLGRFQGSLHVVNDHMVKLMGQKKLWGGCYTEGRAGHNKSTQKSRKQVCGVSSWFLSRLGKIPLPIHPDNPHLTTTTRHVMVGITRSKVILFFFGPKTPLTPLKGVAFAKR